MYVYVYVYVYIGVWVEGGGYMYVCMDIVPMLFYCIYSALENFNL